MTETPEHIPFNKVTLAMNTERYVSECLNSGRIAGNGPFTQQCHAFFQKHYDFRKCFLTTSCTDALEMAAILCNLKPGDEIIIPSYTFPSTANAFLLRGAKVVFADSNKVNPNLDLDHVAQLITPRTKVLVVVHYAGFACDMDKVMEIAERHSLIVIEDAAQAIDAFYKNKPLGSIGHLGTFSFHETKNITCGEGGMLVVNDDRLIDRAEMIWQNGTDRSKYQRGEVDHYEWREIGSSFSPSEVTAAMLLAQLEGLEKIQEKRKAIFNIYMTHLQPLEKQGFLKLPTIPVFAQANAHMFYVLLNDRATRNQLQEYLKGKGIQSAQHYYPLHTSIMNNSLEVLPNCEMYADCLLRLPMHSGLSESNVNRIAEVLRFYFNRSL